MSDFKHINEFRKGTQLRTINEDPTLLSFFLVFNIGDAKSSPLLHPTGGAMHYLKEVMGGDEGIRYSKHLENFQKLLMKINKEMPWFWQELSGLETTQTYAKMEDPYWGKDNKIEITCLEENVELMGSTLMRLYRDACFDYQRWVEVIPESLRRFSVDIFVTEVRIFQQKQADRETNLFGNSGVHDAGLKDMIKPAEPLAPSMSSDAKPLIHVQLGHCLFDMESGKEMLADLTKNPEMKKSKIAFSYSTVKNPTIIYGANLMIDQEELITPNKGAIAAYDPSTKIADILEEKAESKMQKLKDKAMGPANQMKNSLDGVFGGVLRNNPMGNVNNSLLKGAAANIVNSVAENLTGQLFLDNVYGINNAGTIQDAINAGSINGLINAAGQATNGIVKSLAKTKGGTSISPNKVYDAITPNSDVYISESVYDKTAPDNDALGKSNVYDKTAPDNDTLTKDNVYD